MKNNITKIIDALKNWTKKFWPYLLVVVLIVFPWFGHSGYLFFTDYSIGPKINLDWTSSWFLINTLFKFLSFIFPLYFLEKIFIAATLFFVLLGGRKIVLLVSPTLTNGEEFKISPALVFILSLFALFNPVVYDRLLYGQIGIVVAYGALLFVIAYLYRAAFTLEWKNLYGAAIFSALALMFSVHFIFFLALFYVLFFVLLIGKCSEIKVTTKLWPLLRVLIVSLLIIIILNANWLIALTTGASATLGFVAQGIGTQDLTAFATAGATPLQTLTNILLMGGFWGAAQHRYIDFSAGDLWGLGFIFLLPLIIYGIYISFKKADYTHKILNSGLLIIFITAVVLALGIKTSFSNSISLFLYNHLPFYKGLREPQKWVAAMVPVYLYFLSWGVAKLSSKKWLVENAVVVGIILAAVIIIQAPLLLFGFNHQVRPTNYPTSWSEVDRFLLNRSADSYGCFDQVLFLPWHMYMHFSWIGNTVANPASVFFSCPILVGTNMEWGGIYDNSLDARGLAVEKWLSIHGQNNSLPSTVRYIILAKEVDWQTYSWLDGLTYVKLIKDSDNLRLYEIDR
ncbi:MAG: hypothetical protein WCK37_01275 [Candidatus Falkowbacteria bacterium]